MASFLRALSLRTATTMLSPQRAIGGILGRVPAMTMASKQSSLSVLGNGMAQQTRGMKVHSSVKKRCEHCKVCLFPSTSLEVDSARRLEAEANGPLSWKILGRPTERWQATQRIPVHHLQVEPEA
jgi:large subunit ribosomal protein L36